MNKTNSLRKLGNTLVIALFAIGMVGFASCDKTPEPNPNPTPGGGGGGSTNADSWAYLINETPHDVQLEGNTLKYGDHVYTVNGEIDLNGTVFNQPTAWVTFTNIPSGYTEFEAVYNNLLGKSAVDNKGGARSYPADHTGGHTDARRPYRGASRDNSDDSERHSRYYRRHNRHAY